MDLVRHRIFDVLIFGGGPAGAAAAMTLVRSGATVVVLERSYYDTFRVGETLRPNTMQLLYQLGVSDIVLSGDHLPSPGIVASWGSDVPYENDFIFSPFGHGWHLNRRLFDVQLAEAAERAGATVVRGAHVLQCNRVGGSHWRVVLSQAQRTAELQARWVIDVTGRSSWFARRQRVLRVTFDHLVGVFCVFRGCRNDDRRTFIEAHHTGWWYTAALPQDQAIAAFFTDSDLLPRGHFRRREFWESAFQASVSTQLQIGRGDRIFGPRVALANSSRLVQPSGKDWIAVGDAATTFDPLSSQGIAFALESGIRAAVALLVAAAHTGEPCAEYASWVDSTYRTFLDNRSRYYNQEQRWPDVPFWQRRTAALGPDALAGIRGTARIHNH
jgi:flavin-dependent dehydrogenase